MAEKKLEVVKETAGEFIMKLGVVAEIEVEEKEDSSLAISLRGEDLGLLIGYHGETLESLQLLLNLIINKKLASQEWINVSLDVGGWREERQDALKKLAEEAVERAKTTGRPASLPAMSSSQRRFVHLFLQNFPEIESHSEDFGSSRHIVVSLKT